MKKFLYIILLLVFGFCFNTNAQSDSVKSETNTKEKIKTEEEIIPSFKKEKNKKDVFIDKDGDGMCDNRVEGMSLDKMRKRKRSGEGNGKHGGKK